METFAMETTLTSYRTKLLTERQATAFGRMLKSNKRFAFVQVLHQPRAKGEAQWYVRFMPSSVARQEALLQKQQDARAQRAATQQFTFAANRWEVWCYSHTSGSVYRMETNGTGCSCPDQQSRCRGAVHCKHEIAFLASEEKREMDAAVQRRAEQNARFDAIFA